jgi:hypothetical protein
MPEVRSHGLSYPSRHSPEKLALGIIEFLVVFDDRVANRPGCISPEAPMTD